jgi:regulatory protein
LVRLVDAALGTAQSDDVRRSSPDPESLTPSAARALVLRWLAQRELTTSQVRLRLRRRHYPDDTIESTLAALTDERVLDDQRTARAKARHDVAIKRRGPGRVLRQVEALGIDRETARNAVAAAFEDVDQDAMIRAALGRKLRGRAFPTARPDIAKLFAWLLRQGFDGDRVSRVLKKPVD